MEKEKAVVTEKELFLTAETVKLIDSHIFQRLLAAITVLTAAGALGAWSFLSVIKYEIKETIMDEIYEDIINDIEISSEVQEQEFQKSMQLVNEQELELRLRLAEADQAASEAIDLANQIRSAGVSIEKVDTDSPVTNQDSEIPYPIEEPENPALEAQCKEGSIGEFAANRTQSKSDSSSRCRVHTTFSWKAKDGFFFLNDSTARPYSISQKKGTFNNIAQVVAHPEDVKLNGTSQMLQFIAVRAHADGGSGLTKKQCGSSVTLNLKQFPMACAKYIVKDWDQ